PDDSLALARLLFMRSDFLNRLRMISGGCEYGRRAAEMMKRLGDQRYLPFAMAVWGNEQLLTNDLEDAQNNFLEGLAIAREVGHPLMISVLLHRVAWANHYLGNTEGRLVKITEAYHWSKMSQNAWGICFCANSLADMKYYVGQLDEAEPF